MLVCVAFGYVCVACCVLLIDCSFCNVLGCVIDVASFCMVVVGLRCMLRVAVGYALFLACCAIRVGVWCLLFGVCCVLFGLLCVGCVRLLSLYDVCCLRVLLVNGCCVGLSVLAVFEWCACGGVVCCVIRLFCVVGVCVV